jgi:hypothetical protein
LGNLPNREGAGRDTPGSLVRMGWRLLAGRLFGRAADENMYMGMVSPRDPNQEQSRPRGLRQQRTQGRVAAALLRWWPLPLASFAGAVILLIASRG